MRVLNCCECLCCMVFWSKVRPITFGGVAMCSVLLFIFSFRLLLYLAGSGVNRVQALLSGFSVSLLCFVHVNTLCRYGCMYVVVVGGVRLLVHVHFNLGLSPRDS